MAWEKGVIDDAIETMRNGVNCKQNKNQKGVRISRIETISEAVINLDKVGYSELSEDQKQKYLLKSGDILFSHINSPIHVGKTAIHDGVNELYHGVNLMLLRCKDTFSAEYINYYLYYLFSNNYWLTVCKQSVNQASVNQTDIKKMPLKYPSLSEQKQIVEILDAAFASIDKAIENTQTNLANAQELFESIIDRLFKEFEYTEFSIGDICDLMTGGTPSKTKNEYFEGGDINWLVSGDIHKKEITECDNKITELGFDNSSAKYLPINSVMIALNGQGKTRGTVAMLRLKATCNQSLVSIYPKNIDEVLPEYIFENLDSRYQEIRKITGDTGNDRRGLNMPLIRKIVVPVPSITDQKKIISRVQKLKSEIADYSDISQQKLISLNELKQSILQKAFSGELTGNAINEVREAAA